MRYVSTLPALKVPAYWTGDATANWNATNHIGLKAVGQNLFQPHHEEFNYDPGPIVGIRRGFYAQLTFTK